MNYITKSFPEVCPESVQIKSYDQVLAATDYKSISIVGKDTFFLNYYNCGVHVLGFSEARSKYNKLPRLSAQQLAQ